MKWGIGRILLVVSVIVFVSGYVFAASACTTIIVGKDKTQDGSVMLAHSEELGMSAAQQLVKIPGKQHPKGAVYELYSGGTLPEAETTYGYIASKIFDKDYYPGEYTTGINQYQVSVANNMSWTRGVAEEVAWYPPLKNGVIWTEFSQIALERAKTSREAVEIIGMLCEKYNLSSDPGTMFAVADPQEGWWIEIARDGQWIAQRVPDDGAVMRANSYRIGVVDLNDSANILHSPNLVQYAIDNNWYNPRHDGEFDFAKVYGDPANQDDSYNTLRHEMVDEMLVTAKLVSVDELMAIMRSCYEGTDYYQADPDTGSPFHTDVRTISRMNTEVSSVAQLRDWMPANIGGVIWWNLGTAKTGVYVPWHYGTTGFYQPYTIGTNEYNADSAYWTYVELARLTNLSYAKVIDKIRGTWMPFEALELQEQKSVEAEAVDIQILYGEKASNSYLTDYSNSKAEAALKMAKSLLPQVKTEAYYTD